MNLKEFYFSLATKVDHAETTKICKFLENQTNLQNLELATNTSPIFIKSFQKTLQTLPNLRILILNLGDSRFSNENPLHWKLEKLEKIEIRNNYGFNNNLLDCIFHLPSKNLKEIVLEGAHDFGHGTFDKITKNYRSLTKFVLDIRLKNHSNNDIFLILKHLKKLKHLSFGFSCNSPLDATQFNGPDNLMLPEIEKVEFHFNNTITNDHLLKFMPLLNNLKELKLNVHENFNCTSLEIVLKELPNLHSMIITESFHFYPGNVLYFGFTKLARLSNA